MPHAPLHRASRLGLAVAFACATFAAHAEEALNTFEFGYAHIGFNTKSDDLAGPAGTTPPGVKTHLKNVGTLGLIYQRRISGPWSVVLQGGTPPIVKMEGAGAAAALGEVGSVRAWFPALLANYTFDGPWGTRPYVGAGVNYTFYSEEQVEATYTNAFGGTSSTAKMKSSWGPVVRLGVAFPLGQNWLLDAVYARYGIRTTATITTATPGVGDIAHTIDVKADPDIVGLMLGYRF